jgi:putative component of toxin-antitoxin plasmid stabilization module
MVEVRHYATRSGIDVLAEWLAKLADDHARARVADRLDRLSRGNFGDHKSLGGVVLLCGGDKRRQASDIQRAREYFKDYLQRTRIQ